MPPESRPPPDVRALVEQRAAAREAQDWTRADALRDEIAARGWEVQDRHGGSAMRPLLPREPVATGYADPDDLASLLGEPPTVRVSIQVVAEDHSDDLQRLLVGLQSHPPEVDHELVLVANAPSFALDELIPDPSPATILRTSRRLGWADARNLGLRRSRGSVTIVLDTSIEPIGDFVTPLLAAFDDPRVGLAGGWGVTSADGRQFEEAPPGEVDAVEGYCLALRREALQVVEGFDRRFRFYRNADLDLSFALRNAGWRAMRVADLPLVQHEHRGYTALPDVERDRLSKRNFYRFLDHWGDRRDLLLRSDQ
ncbi:MAG: glycosyltransferase [Candidatus Limnocylindria bacterium]